MRVGIAISKTSRIHTKYIFKSSGYKFSYSTRYGKGYKKSKLIKYSAGYVPYISTSKEMGEIASCRGGMGEFLYLYGTSQRDTSVAPDTCYRLLQ